jgi:Family of unknown function (DUF5762)
MAERVWYRAPEQMFVGKRSLRFFPTSSMTVHTQLNSILRFCIYYSAIMVALTMNPRHLLVAVLGAVITAVVSEVAYAGRDETFRSSSEERAECVAPTVDNPHMNFRPFDERDREPACKPWNVDEQVTASAGEPIQDSPFQKSFDRFYTMPCTTAVNDQTGFANWLYGAMPGKQKTVEPHQQTLMS